MILFSKLECVHIYQGFPVVPGRNLIPDDIGRRIVTDPGFQEAMDVGSPFTYGKLVIEVGPAPEEKAAPVSSAKPAAGTKPTKPKAPVVETGVSNLSDADAIKAIGLATVVDQLQVIATNDARDAVKEAAITRIAALAAEAKATGGAGA